MQTGFDNEEFQNLVLPLQVFVSTIDGMSGGITRLYYGEPLAAHPYFTYQLQMIAQDVLIGKIKNDGTGKKRGRRK